jgi:hypothetical protein
MAKSFSSKPMGPKRTAKGVMGKFQQNEFDRKQRIRQELQIHPELEPYIPPLRQEEFDTLESSILEENRVREKLLVWQTPQEEYFLLDGHHRYKVVRKHESRDITWDIEIKEDLADLDEAKRFMRQLQFGRRNLTVNQMAYLRGRTYLDMKKEANRPEGQQQATGKTKDILAAEFKVGPSTILRDAVFCAGVDRFSDKNLPQELQEERDRILLHESLFLKGEIELLGKHPEIELSLAFDFKQAAGDLKTVVSLPETERNQVMQVFLNGNQQPETQSESGDENKPKTTPPSLAERFQKWWNQQDKQILKVLKSNDQQAIDSKKRELEEQARHINALLEKLSEAEN